MINVNKLLAKILSCPFVVEKGTSGVWTYMKWSDGRAECWCTCSNTTTHYTSWIGCYGYNINITFPPGLFNASPIVTYSSKIDSGFAFTGTLANFPTTTGTTCYAVASASGSKTCYWYIYAIGTWK